MNAKKKQLLEKIIDKYAGMLETESVSDELEIESASGKSFTLDDDERDSLTVFVGMLTDAYEADEHAEKFEELRKTLSPKEMEQLKSAFDYLEDTYTYKTANSREMKSDIPVLAKVLAWADENGMTDDNWGLTSAVEKITTSQAQRSKKYTVDVRTLLSGDEYKDDPEYNKYHSYATLSYWGATPRIAAEKALDWCARSHGLGKGGGKMLPYYIDNTTVIRVKETGTPRKSGITEFKIGEFIDSGEFEFDPDAGTL